MNVLKEIDFDKLNDLVYLVIGLPLVALAVIVVIAIVAKVKSYKEDWSNG